MAVELKPTPCENLEEITGQNILTPILTLKITDLPAKTR